MSKSLTEAAKAVLEGQMLNEVSNPNPVDNSTVSTGNAKTLHPGSKSVEGRHGNPGGSDVADFPGADDLGGATPTSVAKDNLGAKAAVAKKDSSKSSVAAVKGDDMKKLAEDDEFEGETIDEEIAAFIENAIEEGYSEEEILAALSEESIEEEEVSPLADYQIDMSEHVEALLSGEGLSEEFQEKATTIFEAAVKSKLEEEVALLEQAYAETLEERVAEIQEQLATDIDNYLNYVVEQWIEENEVAVESALRSELTEDFIGGLRSLFAEHYIDIPEQSVNVVEELSQTVEDLEAKLNEEIERNVALTTHLNESRKNELVAYVCEGLTNTQTEKLKNLVETVDYTNDEEFINKISTLRENYIPSSVKSDEVLDRVESAEPGLISESNLEGPMAKYVQALGRSLPK